MRSADREKKQRKRSFIPASLNIKLFLIFLGCFMAASFTFFLFVFKYSELDTLKQRQEQERVEKVLVHLTNTLQGKHIKLDDIEEMGPTIDSVKDDYPTWGFLVADAKGNIIFQTKNNHTQRKNIKPLLKQKLAPEFNSNPSVNKGYFPFISLVSFQDDLGYLVVEAPSSKVTIDTTNYNHKIQIAFLCSILVFLLLFFLCMRPITRYIKQIEQGISRIVNKDWNYSIPVKGKNELSSLAKNINWMTEQLRERFERERQVEQAKNELITNLSHDLRTPLTSIIGYVRLVKDGQYQNQQELEQYIQTTYNISLKFKNLLDELFEYTKLSLSDVELHFQEVNLGGVLYQLVGEYTPIFENRGLDVKVKIPDDPVFISVDIEKIIRVLDNLFSNAEKYSHECGHIEVTLHSTREQVIISVSNTTDHIEAKELKNLFNRFYRMDKARSSKVAGSGIGLSIAKRIVELHEGDIWAESDNNKVKIHIALPLHHDTKEK
ncbi:sensor histidine kinase [Priestia endophytica]|uniref:sensor histidine kinase n=1 Tax=Priestia endophytica TaxID=135735 RepID=UPI00124BFC54|nr:HAMP domain-containing sensor histidine kinase [Priestia endophytica]KAB2494199.1 HAMP domain-containing histidine kinase [Priestia endophytica]